jgi:hypothetical protein
LALYLVIHTPKDLRPDDVRPPTRLRDLAVDATREGRSPRWLKTWSPDVHDDRIFTLWEAKNGEEILTTLAEFGFLDDMDSSPLRVREWGPADVLAAED